MPPAVAFWKALAMAGITNVVVWSAILYWIGPKAGEWDLYLIFFSLSFLLTLFALYRGYVSKNVPMTRQRHRRTAVFCGLLAVFWLVAVVFDRRSRWDLALRIVLATVYALYAAGHLRKASQPGAVKILPG